MNRLLTFTQNEMIQNITIDQIKAYLENEDRFLWLDMAYEPGDNCKSILEDVFHFHPLAIDDALQETHIPKVDNWNTYLYVVIRTVFQDDPETIELCTPELDIFLGSNYLVTYHKENLPQIDKVWDLCSHDHLYLSRGIGFLLYQIIDEIVTNIIYVIDGLDDKIDGIEDVLFTNPPPKTLEEIFAIKRVVLQLRRTLLPQREVLFKLGRGDFKLIQEQDLVYFLDIYDHLVRLQEVNESLRDLVTGALDTYLSVVNNRMNDVMKTLTIFTALFMPLSFLTGFFGMNFFRPVIEMTVWTGKFAFGLILAVLLITPFSMVLWMHKRAWM